MSNISDWFESKCGPELLRRVAAFVVMLMVIQLAATALQKLFSLLLPGEMYLHVLLNFLRDFAALYVLWRVLRRYQRREDADRWYLRWKPAQFVLALLTLAVMYSALDAAGSVAAALHKPLPAPEATPVDFSELVPAEPHPWLYANLLLYAFHGPYYMGLAVLCRWWCEIRWRAVLRAGAALLCFYSAWYLAATVVPGRLALTWVARNKDALVRPIRIYLGAIESDTGWYYHFGLFAADLPLYDPQYLLFITLAFLQYVPFLLLGWLAYVLYHRSHSVRPVSARPAAE